jgi:anti-sigma factor RsiW
MTDCRQVERHLDAYVEQTAGPQEREATRRHLERCPSCRELAACIREAFDWTADFPELGPPDWLATRILANTPPVVRERWRDTFLGAWRWITEPRMAMTVFASVFILGWVSNVLGMPLDVSGMVRNPSGALYSAEGVMSQVYDQAVRSYYRSPIVHEIYCRIEQLKESPE